MKIIAIYLVLLIVISGCATVEPIPHPALVVPDVPTIKPYFTRDELNCKETPTVCKKIKQREELLNDHINTLNGLIQLHNEELK